MKQGKSRRSVYLDSLVVRGSDEVFAVGWKVHRPHSACMPLHCHWFSLTVIQRRENISVASKTHNKTDTRDAIHHSTVFRIFQASTPIGCFRFETLQVSDLICRCATCKWRKFTYALGIQIRTVLSFEADANTSPSGENFTSVTTPFKRIKSFRTLEQE